MTARCCESRTRACPEERPRSRHARGWDHYLPRLAAVASGGDPGLDPWIERPEL